MNTEIVETAQALSGLGGRGMRVFKKPLTPNPSPTQAGRGETVRGILAPLPEFGEGLGVRFKG